MARIQQFRERYDRQYSLLGPHFSIVFPIDNISRESFIEEADKQCKGIPAFTFVFTGAVAHKDSFDTNHYVFLTPGEGRKHIKELHNKLYSDAFQHFCATILTTYLT